MPPVNATFQGYTLSGRGVSFTRTPGVSANANSLSIATGSPVTLTSGSMYFSDGSNTLTLANHYAEEYHDASSEAGEEWRAIIVDRRWLWQYGKITAEHNKPTKEGAVNNETHLKGLATALLDAMGEVDYDVSGLPENVYPHVRWVAAVPAQELNRLLQEYDYVLCLRNDDTVKIWKRGDGTALPAGSKKRYSVGYKRQRRPGKVTIRGGRSIVQRTFDLIAYGLDTDGAWKPLQDLSYAPDAVDADGGFGEDARNFWATGAYSDAERKLARETIFRTYGPASDDLVYRPWLDRIVDTKTENGVTRPKEPVVEVAAGDAVIEWDGDRFVDKAGGGMSDGYSIDPETGLVKFVEPQADVDDNDRPTKFVSVTVQATVAYLSCADDGTWSDTDFFELSSGAGSPEGVYKNEHLVLRGIWDPVGEEPVWENEAELNTFAQAWIDEIELGADFVSSEEVEYNGIVDIDCDGCIKSVTWNVSEAGATTVACLHTERALGRAPTYVERTKRTSDRRQIQRDAIDVDQGEFTGATELERVTIPEPFKLALPYASIDRGERRNVYNDSGSTIDAHGAVEFDGWDAGEELLKVKQPTSGNLPYWAIADREIADSGKGQVFVTGPHYVLTDGSVSAGDHVAPQNGSHEVTTNPNGSAYVLRTATVGGDPEALVAMNSPCPGAARRWCKVTVDNANGTYDVEDLDDGWTAEDIKIFELQDVDYWNGGGVDNYVQVKYKPDGKWYICVGWATILQS